MVRLAHGTSPVGLKAAQQFLPELRSALKIMMLDHAATYDYGASYDHGARYDHGAIYDHGANYDHGARCDLNARYNQDANMISCPDLIMMITAAGDYNDNDDDHVDNYDDNGGKVDDIKDEYLGLRLLQRVEEDALVALPLTKGCHHHDHQRL